MNFLSSELRPGLCVHTDHRHHLSSKLPQAQAAQKMIPLFSSSLEEGQNAHGRGRLFIGASLRITYSCISCHRQFLRISDCSSAVNEQWREWSRWREQLNILEKLCFSKKNINFQMTWKFQQGPQPEIVTAGTRRSTTSQREVPQIHTPRRSTVHGAHPKAAICLSNRCIPCLVE